MDSDTMHVDSTPRASLACSNDADQAGSCLFMDSTPRASLACSNDADHARSCPTLLKDVPSVEELAQHLLDKGLTVSSRQDLIRALSAHGYHRLKGYWLTFERKGSFKRGTALSDILEIEAFNRELSSFLFEQIAPIEIALRARLTTSLAQRYGANALHCRNVFNDEQDFNKLQNTLERETDQSIFSKKPFALHNMREYGQLPIWAEMQNTSFGTISRIFENLEDDVLASKIAHDFGVPRLHLKNWLRYLTQIRNACAHHDRLYNRMFCIKPRLFKEHQNLDHARLFPAFIVLFRLHEVLDPQRANLLRAQLGRIVDAHPTVDLKPVGFPANWREVLRIPSPSACDMVRPRGRQGGHPLKDAAVIEQALYQYDMREGTVAEIAKRCGLSLSTLYKYINLRKQAAAERVDYAATPL